MPRSHPLLQDDPLWYRDAIVYELHVRSFMDSTGNGIGDFRGLTSKLDYVQDLGVTALWLLPFYPSPLRDDGYDIADYRQVNPHYGTLADFRTFLDEAHARGLRVITELVVNHTSDQHPWFQRARRAPPGHPHRDYYVWSEHPDRYSDARIIFKDFETSNWSWDPVAEAYFWHRFYHHQPDLNFDNPLVREELFAVLDYWLEMGVDGLRLDAVPYLYQREGTSCENLPETHAFLKELRAHVDRKFDNRMLLAEANQWPEDAAAYFGDGDECHMNFHFPIMPRLFMSVRMEDRFPLVDILEQTPTIPETCQWALFLRNHDELTLEMVTDEERDYMYRAYARNATARINLGIRRRLAPLLENNRRRIELLNALLMSLPGTPVIYYGDEIGMGDNFYLGDRNGVRTPMQWSSDRNAGFSRANPQQLYLPVIIDPEYHFESVNVEAQHSNPNSLLWWMRRLSALRRRSRAFGRGSVEWVNPENRKVLAFIRRYEDEVILMVANLSRYAQAASIELAEFRGWIPVELFSRSPFPSIREEPYPITLGPHAFFWFSLQREFRRWEAPELVHLPVEEVERLPTIRTSADDWGEAFRDWLRPQTLEALTEYLRRQRWFAGKNREIRNARIQGITVLGLETGEARVVRLGVEYVDEEPETYLLPLSWTSQDTARRMLEGRGHMAVCRLQMGNRPGFLHDAVLDPGFGQALLSLLAREGEEEEIEGDRVLAGDRTLPEEEILLPPPSPPTPSRAEQSNTSLVFGNQWILKLLRKVEDGVNLDREVGLALTSRGFEGSPALGGSLEYRTPGGGGGGVSTVAVLHRYVPNEGDAWEYTLDMLERFLDQTASHGEPEAKVELSFAASLGPPAASDPAGDPGWLLEHLDPSFPDLVSLLGRRTGELHQVLASVEDHPVFFPEPFNALYRRSLYQSLRNQLGRSLAALRRRRDRLPAREADAAESILAHRDEFLGRFRILLERPVGGHRIRTHGDFHLGQVLFTGNDFQIIDFEGEPARALTERLLKRSALRDVAGMVRSLDYASLVALKRRREGGLAENHDLAELERWTRSWYRWAADRFLRGYAEVVGDAPFLPGAAEDRGLVLELMLLEKALYELTYELDNRPDWVGVPLAGLRELQEDP